MRLNMGDKTYAVLYTHQKTKKAKTWQDGTLKVLPTGTKAVLYDERGTKLDALHVHASDVVLGEQLESDRYYIQVEELKQTSSQPTSLSTDAAAWPSFTGSSISSSQHASQQLLPLRQEASSVNARYSVRGNQTAAGVKRKRNGFIPPRMVKPRPAENTNDASDPCPQSAPTFTRNTFSTPLSAARGSVETSTDRNTGIVQGSAGSRVGAFGEGHQAAQLYTQTVCMGKEIPRSPQNLSTMPDRGIVTSGEGFQGREVCPRFGSPDVQSKVVAGVKNNSPWRTFGTSSLKPVSASSSVLQEETEHLTHLTDTRNNVSVGPDSNVTSRWGQFCGSESESHSELPSPDCAAAGSFSMTADSTLTAGPAAATGLLTANPKAPPVKRSAAEIMALLKRTNASSSSPWDPGSKPDTDDTASEGRLTQGSSLQLSSPNTNPNSLKQNFGLQKDRSFSPSAPKPFVPSPHCSGKSLKKFGPDDDDVQKTGFSSAAAGNRSPHMQILTGDSNPQSVTNVFQRLDVSPRLSESTASLSKHDFELDNDACTVSSARQTLGDSQALSESDFPAYGNSGVVFEYQRAETFTREEERAALSSFKENAVAFSLKEEKTAVSSMFKENCLTTREEGFDIVQTCHSDSMNAHVSGTESSIDYTKQVEAQTGPLAEEKTEIQVSKDQNDVIDGCFDLGFSPFSDDSCDEDNAGTPLSPVCLDSKENVSVTSQEQDTICLKQSGVDGFDKTDRAYEIPQSKHAGDDVCSESVSERTVAQEEGNKAGSDIPERDTESNGEMITDANEIPAFISESAPLKAPTPSPSSTRLTGQCSSADSFNPIMLTPPSAQLRGGRCEHKRVKDPQEQERTPDNSGNSGIQANKGVDSCQIMSSDKAASEQTSESIEPAVFRDKQANADLIVLGTEHVSDCSGQLCFFQKNEGSFGQAPNTTLPIAEQAPGCFEQTCGVSQAEVSGTEQADGCPGQACQDMPVQNSQVLAESQSSVSETKISVGPLALAQKTSQEVCTPEREAEDTEPGMPSISVSCSAGYDFDDKQTCQSVGPVSIASGQDVHAATDMQNVQGDVKTLNDIEISPDSPYALSVPHSDDPRAVPEVNEQETGSHSQVSVVPSSQTPDVQSSVSDHVISKSFLHLPQTQKLSDAFEGSSSSDSFEKEIEPGSGVTRSECTNLANSDGPEMPRKPAVLAKTLPADESDECCIKDCAEQNPEIEEKHVSPATEMTDRDITLSGERDLRIQNSALTDEVPEYSPSLEEKFSQTSTDFDMNREQDFPKTAVDGSPSQSSKTVQIPWQISLPSKHCYHSLRDHPPRSRALPNQVDAGHIPRTANAKGVSSLREVTCTRDNFYGGLKHIGPHTESHPGPHNNLAEVDGHKQSSSSSSGVHRFFQTASDIFIKRVSDSTGEVAEDLTVSAVQRRNKLGGRERQKSWGPERLSDLSDSSMQYQPLVSTLPHPDHLITGSSKHGSEQHKHLSGDKIAQAISAKLTNYKMQGMVCSQVVERPMAWRRPAPSSQSTNTPSLCQSQHLRAEEAGYSKHSAPWVFESSEEGKLGPQMWQDFKRTPEARLQSPSADQPDGPDSSFFVDWNDDKPHFVPLPSLPQHAASVLGASACEHEVPQNSGGRTLPGVPCRESHLQENVVSGWSDPSLLKTKHFSVEAGGHFSDPLNTCDQSAETPGFRYSSHQNVSSCSAISKAASVSNPSCKFHSLSEKLKPISLASQHGDIQMKSSVSGTEPFSKRNDSKASFELKHLSEGCSGQRWVNEPQLTQTSAQPDAISVSSDSQGCDVGEKNCLQGECAASPQLFSQFPETQGGLQTANILLKLNTQSKFSENLSSAPSTEKGLTGSADALKKVDSETENAVVPNLGSQDFIGFDDSFSDPENYDQGKEPTRTTHVMSENAKRMQNMISPVLADGGRQLSGTAPKDVPLTTVQNDVGPALARADLQQLRDATPKDSSPSTEDFLGPKMAQAGPQAGQLGPSLDQGKITTQAVNFSSEVRDANRHSTVHTKSVVAIDCRLTNNGKSACVGDNIEDIKASTSSNAYQNKQHPTTISSPYVVPDDALDDFAEDLEWEDDFVEESTDAPPAGNKIRLSEKSTGAHVANDRTNPRAIQNDSAKHVDANTLDVLTSSLKRKAERLLQSYQASWKENRFRDTASQDTSSAKRFKFTNRSFKSPLLNNTSFQNKSPASPCVDILPALPSCPESPPLDISPSGPTGMQEVSRGETDFRDFETNHQQLHQNPHIFGAKQSALQQSPQTFCAHRSAKENPVDTDVSPPLDISPLNPTVPSARMSGGHSRTKWANEPHTPMTNFSQRVAASNFGPKRTFPKFHQTTPCNPLSPEFGMQSSEDEQKQGVKATASSIAFSVPRKIGLGGFKKPSLAGTSGSCLPGSQVSLCQELQFCSKEEVDNQVKPLRQVTIPVSFDSVASYKRVLTAALTEFLNIQLFDLAKTYHTTLANVDVSAYTEGVSGMGKQSAASTNPPCKCGKPSKVAQVKKDGPNKGRFFYACTGPREKQCKFFQWMDQQERNSNARSSECHTASRPKFGDADSIAAYFRGQGVTLFCQCQVVTRSEDQFFRRGVPAWVRGRRQSESVEKKTTYLRLSKKGPSSIHSKDDLWVISKSLRFDHRETFIARSTFHGPNSNGEVAIDPMAGYSASQWNDGSVCHAIHAGNAASELACMLNLQEHVDLTSLPVLLHLLSNMPSESQTRRLLSGKGFKAPAVTDGPSKLHIPGEYVHELAAEFVSKYKLNSDQAAALWQAADMMNKDAEQMRSVLLIHGVFGAGKSFLLSVIILFLVEVFKRNEMYTPGVPFPWKLLLSSTTNVAVDRVLLGLLELGFDDFVRVGSVKKIAKMVLPYSVHASGSDSQELKDLQEMLKSADITPAEKHCVRRSIEKHRLGENRKRLGAVRVVGVTCAACSFQCMEKMQFPFVVLDECSQMTEPASLLPIARFACEKLILVGDPKQLDPTLQGSEPAHTEGLEQTLFDRLMKMGHEPVMLRTQYRCHPTISAIANDMFYQNQLVDGITADDRQPLLDMFPTVCFYDVANGQESTDSTGSCYNEAEAQFVLLLLGVLVAQRLAPPSLGVITLYKAQARRIQDIIRVYQGPYQKALAGVQVSTVDAFQGGERDIIILSCVCSRSLGFIDSDKRMNVALTRARHHLLIVGHQRNLHRNSRWAQVISHCQGVTGGVVSASQAARDLQAVLDEAAENDEPVPASGKPLSSSNTPARGQRRKSTGKALGQIDVPPDSPIQVLSAEDLPEHTSKPPTPPAVSCPFNSTEDLQPTDTNPAVEKQSVSEDTASPVRKSGRLRAKPLVIEEESESSDSDFLPEGL